MPEALKKILIVDDDVQLTEILGRILTEHGYSVDTLNSGLALLSYFRENKEPDLLILDIVMGGRSGYELINTVKSVWKNAKVMIYSAHPEYDHKIPKSHVDAFVSKPRNLQDLLSTIEGLLA